MGSNLSCLCPNKGSSCSRYVVITKRNGKVLKAKEGTLVKHILASYPHHYIVQRRRPDGPGLGSDYPVVLSLLPESFQLGCTNENEKYLLMAEGQPLSSRKGYYGGGSGGGDIDHNNNGNKLLQLTNDSFEYKKLPWKPALHSIPEIHSPHNL